MLKAIETQYKGYRFRSRLEARWAVFFDALGVPWEYEKEGFDLDDAGWYLPDFWLPREKCWIEIKPKLERDVKPLRIYLAGGVDPDWRVGLDTRGHRVTGPDLTKNAHDIQLHGSSSGDMHDIVKSCFDGIDEANMVFAWIDSPKRYGTLIELGYAKAKDKLIFVCLSNAFRDAIRDDDGYVHNDPGPFEDTWFVQTIAYQDMVCHSPQEGLDQCLPRWTEDETKCKALSEHHPCYLVRGDPYHQEYSITVFPQGRWCHRNHHFSLRPAFRDHEEILETLSEEFGYYSTTIDRTMAAYQTARSARFEHGEQPIGIIRPRSTNGKS